MCEPFYLNIFLLNKDEIVSAKVQEKAGAGKICITIIELFVLLFIIISVIIIVIHSHS